mgnify:CR=1 FL=1
MATKLYLSAERVSREDEFEHYLQIARDRNLGIEIQEFYLHVHNNHGEEDSHNPVRDGTIDFEQLFERLDKWQVAPIAATEIYGQGLIESIDYLEKKMATTRCYGNT